MVNQTATENITAIKEAKKQQNGLDYLFDDHNEKPTNAFKDATDLLNEHRTNLSVKDIDDIRKKLYRKEIVYNALKRRDKLSYEENNILKRTDKYLNNFKSNLEKHEENINAILHMV